MVGLFLQSHLTTRLIACTCKVVQLQLRLSNRQTDTQTDRQTDTPGFLSTHTISQRLVCLTFTLSPNSTGQSDSWQITEQRPNYDSTYYLTAYVMRSGLRALIMHSLWSELLFFHSWGNFSFSGHSDSTNFFQRLAEPSMSRSRFLNSSMEHKDWWLKKEKWFVWEKLLYFFSAATLWSVMRIKVFDHYHNAQQKTLTLQKLDGKMRQECLSFPTPL